MVGVLIVTGIIGYALIYSGLSALPSSTINKGVPVSTLEALWPGHGTTKPATASNFPKPTHSNPSGSRPGPGGPIQRTP